MEGHKVSKEVKELDSIEGKLTDIVKLFLNAKKAKYSIAEPKEGDNVARIKGVEPFVEKGSIIIEQDGERIIIEELSKVCGISGRYHRRDGIDIDCLLDRAKRVLFRTRKGKSDLYIHADVVSKEPTFGLYLGGGEISATIKNILKEPSDIPDSDETFEINCECAGELKCKGKVWSV